MHGYWLHYSRITLHYIFHIELLPAGVFWCKHNLLRLNYITNYYYCKKKLNLCIVLLGLYLLWTSFCLCLRSHIRYSGFQKLQYLTSISNAFWCSYTQHFQLLSNRLEIKYHVAYFIIYMLFWSTRLLPNSVSSFAPRRASRFLFLSLNFQTFKIPILVDAYLISS